MVSLADACKGQQFTESTLWGPCVEGFLGPKKNTLSRIKCKETTQNKRVVEDFEDFNILHKNTIIVIFTCACAWGSEENEVRLHKNN